MDEVELIHMNGRVYDYNVGRFLSVDPFVHGGSQGINPYSYILNNPLAGTDPTGYEPECHGDDLACQWDQSISSVTGIPREEITAMYNQKAANKNNGADQSQQQHTHQPSDSSDINSVSEIAKGDDNSDEEGDWGFWDSIQTGLDIVGMIPVVGEVADLANAGISVARGDYEGAALSIAAMVPFAGNAVGAAKIAKKVDRIMDLAEPGEDLFVGTYNKSRRANLRNGLNSTHTPHHAVQNAVSETTHGKGITINIRKDVHEQTRTYRKPVEQGLNNRTHLARDVKDLRKILRREGYDMAKVNRQLRELIKQNKEVMGQ